MTMLLVNPFDCQPRSRHSLHMDIPYSSSSSSSSPTSPTGLPTYMLEMLSMASPVDHAPPVLPLSYEADAVAQALEIARETPDGMRDPTVSKTLESALAAIWSKVLAQPDTYVMSKGEFAVFNFFQHRFKGNRVAVAARKRYWDNLSEE